MKVTLNNQLQALEPARVRKAVSERAEVIEPFQYYSEVGEQILSLDFSSHEDIARLYLHIDADGKQIARVLIEDSLAEIELGNIPAELSSGLDGAEQVGEDFALLLHEMHLMAGAGSGQLFDQAELDELIERSRNAPIVIGGCGRSGTTLLLSILGAHPAIMAFADEMYSFYPRPFRIGKLLEAISEKEVDANWRRWCEKTPKNVRAFESIDAAFSGNVRMIHVVRDGRDVVSSHHPNAAETYYVSPQRWVADVRAGLEQKERTLLVRYEDLVSDSEGTLQKICEFIGEAFDARMLNFEQHSTVKENKAWEGKKVRALHQERVEGWRAPEHEERVTEFMNTAGAEELLDELGYS